MMKSERVYKGSAREPLGKPYDRHYNLPEKFTVHNEAFGVKSKSSLEPAKAIIFPTLTPVRKITSVRQIPTALLDRLLTG